MTFWVTKEQFDRGFEAELFRVIKKWLADEWPFERVEYPKREV